MTTQELSTKDLELMLAQRKSAEKAELKKRQIEYVNQKEAFIKKTVVAFCDAASFLKELKTETINQGNDLHTKMYDIFNKEEKDHKSFSLISEDGMFKVEISTHDFQTFNEQSEVHLNSIKEIMEEKFASRNKGVYAILNDIMMKNKKGDYDETLVVKLNKHRDTVNDPKFNFALDELAKCFQTYNSATYVRVFQKNEANQWKAVNIQFSSL